MSTVSPFAERIQDAFGRRSGVVRLVDELLVLCRQHGLRLEWQNGICQVGVGSPEPVESVEVTIPESVFRALLARIASLCNDHAACSVSPYGGEGMLAADAGATSYCQIAFSNRPGDLWLTMSRCN
ncbi:MAG TPA: hypothetical protein VJ783_31025 [Pirellulales bacterium]|nr:hypothetical protein [Pirellulales bacterium]